MENLSSSAPHHLLLSRTLSFLTLAWETFSRAFSNLTACPSWWKQYVPELYKKHSKDISGIVYSVLCPRTRHLCFYHQCKIPQSLWKHLPYLVALKRNILFSLLVSLCSSLSSLCFLTRYTKNSVSSLQEIYIYLKIIMFTYFLP